MKLGRSRQKGGVGAGLAAIIIFVATMLIIGLALSWYGATTQEEGSVNVMGMYIGASAWFIFIGAGVFLIIFGITMTKISSSKAWVYMAKAGMVLISLSLLIVILTIVLPLLTGKVLTFDQCKSLIDVGGLTEGDVYRSVACIFAGYAPSKGATPITYVNFIITSVIAPFVFFYYIFNDLMGDMNFPRDDNARKAIAFTGAWVALRGALSTYFVEFFAFGWFGMGALAFGVFMEMMAWSLVRRYFSGVLEHEEMKNFFDMLTENKNVSAKLFLETMAKAPNCPTMLRDHLPELMNWFTRHAGPSVATAVERIAQGMPQKKPYHYVSKELRKVADTLS